MIVSYIPSCSSPVPGVPNLKVLFILSNSPILASSMYRFELSISCISLNATYQLFFMFAVFTRVPCTKQLCGMKKNITLSADADLIEKARQKATQEQSSLNERFREWLKQYVEPQGIADNYLRLMDQLEKVQPGRKFSRDELNER